MVIEHADAGIDTVNAYFDVYTLPDNVENLICMAVGRRPICTAPATISTTSCVPARSRTTSHSSGSAATTGSTSDLATARSMAVTATTTSRRVRQRLIYGGAGDDDLSGSHGTNVVYGGTDKDRLDGFFGINTLYGGAGDDEYVVRETNDLVVENANEGIDRVQAWESYTFTANVENLQLVGRDIDGTGNGLDNIIDGHQRHQRPVRRRRQRRPLRL